MPNLLSAEHVSLALGTSVLLDHVTVGVSAGDRTGIVGRNGSGKSTLLQVLAGRRRVDDGRIATVGGLTVGLLTQQDEVPADSTVHQAVLGDRVEHEWAGDARIRSILDGLLGGVTLASVGGPEALVGPLSGGERRRVALARLLIDDPGLLLLDEPTNHLDIEGVQWLADYLTRRRSRDSAFLAVTHDRWFLDAVSQATWELVDGHVEQYEGGYAAYVLAKNERARIASVTAERRANLMRKELAWLRRGAPARTSKPKFRLEAAGELIKDEPPPRDDVELMRFATTRLGKDVIDLLNATVRLGDRVVLDRQTWRLAPGERTGVIGVNGAGKSTLLGAIAGTVPLTGGKRKQGKTVALAMLTQEVRELDRVAGMSVIDALTQVRSYTMLDGKEVSASSLAKRLGFSGSRQQTRVADLSGGERRRLQFLRLLMGEPNVLLLDEPTNDLDIETLTSMEDVLDGWAGTLVVVSHDRYLLERMCDRQVAMLGDGRIRDLPGGVEEYLSLRSAVAAGAADPPRGTASSDRAPGGGSSTPAQDQRAARKAMARVEKQLTRVQEKEQRLHDALVEAATDHQEAARLHQELTGLQESRAELEEQWLAAAEQLE